MIVTPIGVDIAHYPAIFAHLSRYQAALEKRWDQGKHWWELRACDYYPAFAQPKIVYPVQTDRSRFCYDVAGAFTNDKAFIIPTDDVYLLGILNSSSAWQLLSTICSPLRGGFFELRTDQMKQVSVPNAPKSDRNAIADLVQHCLDAQGVNCGEWEREIDARVAALYGLEP